MKPVIKRRARQSNRLPQSVAEQLVAEFIANNPGSVLAGYVPSGRKSVASIP